ncbi:MAG: NHLP bacteriocin export ABC transporter permease/ATPase subunit [Clostridia bacterium]|nr:NHLP bacteriocin export ABC transporter permease/ATPase subunit [Clostridia bacterium]
MGWFDRQIRQRMQSDQHVFEESFVRLAGAVLGGRSEKQLEDHFLIAREALEEILKFYHCKAAEVPDSVRNADEQMEYLLRPLGIMTRTVVLEEGWYKDAFGPMMGFLKEGGTPVALLPHPLHGYWFKDPATARHVRLSRKTAALFDAEAICFYKPLPPKKLGIPDLLLYMKNCLFSNDYALIALATLAVTLVGMLVTQASKAITGPVLKSGSTSMLVGMAFFLLSAAFSAELLSVVRQLMMSRINTKTSLQVEAAVMTRVLSLPVSFFRNYASGDLASRVGSVKSLCEMLVSQIMSTGLTSLISLLYISQIFSFAPLLVWPSIVIILSTVILGAVFSLMQVKLSERKMKLAAQEAGMTYATVSGIQKIRLSGAEKRAFARWANLYARNAEMAYNPPTILKMNRVFLSAISLIGNIVLYYLAVKSGVGESGYYAFNIAYGQVMGAFAALASIAASIAAFRPVLKMAEPILKAEPEVTEEKEVLTRVSGSIELSHVSFRYEENTPYIFTDLSIKIKAGEYVAVVERTGCGKSTLIRLLLGFEKPEKGAVYYDGKDLARIDPRSLRRKMGVVTQNGKLFQGDIYSNIVISAPQLTMKGAWEAAEIAGIADDIRDMPMGMQTIISERQGGISGGQKQRLMIARAVAPKLDILIFDEDTSALDNKTQKQVSDALDRLKCTRIVVAHRLSTIRNCDRILMLDKGEIIEDGTYDQIIAQGGFFAQLVERQRLDQQSNAQERIKEDDH